MPRQKDIKTQYVVQLYTVQHLTMEEVGKLTGMSRVGICKRLKKAGILSIQGERVQVACNFCGHEYSLTRGRWHRFKEHFCREECYFASRENPAFKPWRQGQRLARAIVAQYHRFLPGQVVHHIDSDCRNNNLSNLTVYASNGDHIKATHHKNSKVKPVWDGANL